MAKIRLALATALCCSAVAHAQVAQQPEGTPGSRPEQQPADRSVITLRQLDRVIGEVRFEELPFQEVLDWVRAQGVQNMIVYWAHIQAMADVDRDVPVSLQLSGIPLGEALDFVLESLSAHAFRDGGQLTYRVRKGVLEISNRAHFAENIVVRTYQVDDLLQSLIFYQDAVSISVAGTAGGGSGPGGGGGPGSSAPDRGTSIFESSGGAGRQPIDFGSVRQLQIDRLIEVLRQIKPQTWEDGGGGGTISAFEGKLVIAQTLEMHEIIAGAFRQTSR